MGILTRKKDAKARAKELSDRFDISYGDDPSTYQLVDKETGQAVPVSMAGVGTEDKFLSPNRRYKRLIGREVQEQLTSHVPPKPSKKETIDSTDTDVTSTVQTETEKTYTKAISDLNKENKDLRTKLSKKTIPIKPKTVTDAVVDTTPVTDATTTDKAYTTSAPVNQGSIVANPAYTGKPGEVEATMGSYVYMDGKWQNMADVSKDKPGWQKWIMGWNEDSGKSKDKKGSKGSFDLDEFFLGKKSTATEVATKGIPEVYSAPKLSPYLQSRGTTVQPQKLPNPPEYNAYDAVPSGDTIKLVRRAK